MWLQPEQLRIRHGVGWIEGQAEPKLYCARRRASWPAESVLILADVPRASTGPRGPRVGTWPKPVADGTPRGWG